MICSKLASRFPYETMTPAGERVDPEVYCKYAVSEPVPPRALDPLRASRSSKSTSMTDGADPLRLRLNILGDIARYSGRRENDRGRRVAQHRTNALIAGAA